MGATTLPSLGQRVDVEFSQDPRTGFRHEKIEQSIRRQEIWGANLAIAVYAALASKVGIRVRSPNALREQRINHPREVQVVSR